MIKNWTIISPDGKTVMNVALSDCGKLTYSVSQDDICMVECSNMGIATEVGDFTAGLTYVSEADEEINETYTMISGKRKVNTNHCNQKTIGFTKDDVKFDLIVRVYNDGIAFRYVVTTETTRAMLIEPDSETTTFKIPNGSRFWQMERRGRTNMYESNYTLGVIGETAVGAQPSLPMLYEVGDKYGLVMEADRHGNFCGSLLRLGEDGVMQVISDLVQHAPIHSAAPFTSPWRTVIIGSPADIMQNMMVENLSPAPDPKYDFASWVKPGVSSWSWVSYYGGQEDPNIHKKFIDLAADMGWDYYILDERWQPEARRDSGVRYQGMQEWFPEVKAHADKKGVKLFAWVDKIDVAKRSNRIARFKEWSEAGIVGIKVDFFFNEAQDMLQLYDDIYRDAAEYKLMVNPHGSNPPSGELRTWPNSLSREAIRGQEQGGITTEQYTLIPFLRSAVGTADVTEQLYSRDVNKTSMGFQIALSTLIENGLHSMGSKPEEYYSRPAAVSLYTNFPKSWDELYVIDAIVGEKVNLARRSGDAWFAAGISVEAGTFTYKPAFLDADKTYTAVVYHEKAGERQDIDMYVKKDVTADTELSVDVQAGGGYTIKFLPQGESDLKSISASESEVTVEAYYTKEVSLAFEPVDSQSASVVWSVADESVARISTTAKGAVIKGLKAGKTTVCAASIYDEDKKAVIDVTVTPAKFVLDGENWNVLRDNANYVISGENEVTITAESGVLDKNVFATKAPEGDFELTATISGDLNANWQGGFIGVFTDALEDYVSVGRRYHTNKNHGGAYAHNHVALMSNHSEDYYQDPAPTADVTVRLVKQGDRYTASYKADGEWVEVQTLESKLEGELLVGFYTGCGGSTNSIDFTIRDFSVNGKAANPAKAN